MAKLIVNPTMSEQEKSDINLVMAVSFDAESHTYTEVGTGHAIPNITRMLVQCGLVDDRWYTEEGSARGREVHRLTAKFDLGSLTEADKVGAYAGWLQAYGYLRRLSFCDFEMIEEPLASKKWRFAGTPDRCGLIIDSFGILNIKTGAPGKGDPIQTALEAILYEEICWVPAKRQGRYNAYIKANGRGKLVRQYDEHDFSVAKEVIAQCCDY